ncbi:MAG TPA: mechanosensitive ion channel domain-containing protein [Hanamia sp.]|nr:mechanosensitive ion channel domain-containing protein [Hanamia sp.]
MAKIERKNNKAQKKSSFVWLGTYVIISLIALAAYILLRLHIFDLLGKYRLILQKFSLAVFFAIVILAISKFVEVLIHKNSAGKYSRYNLIHLTRLISIILVAIIMISFLFSNWYAAAVSLGLISLILGFALQTPISSFIGWIYIIIRNPYSIGDRIQMTDFKGDVIEIGYFDTTLWEFGGDYLTNDLPSGRLIRFPNSLVLENAVYNYSWEDFEYIWNQIPFYVAYTSDLEFVTGTIRRITTEELGPQMIDRIKQLKEMVKNSPVDEIQIKEYPYVTYSVDNNTWVQVTVTYLVPPRKASRFRTNIIHKILDELNKAPEKVMFPKGDSR